MCGILLLIASYALSNAVAVNSKAASLSNITLPFVDEVFKFINNNNFNSNTKTFSSIAMVSASGIALSADNLYDAIQPRGWQ